MKDIKINKSWLAFQSENGKSGTFTEFVARAEFSFQRTEPYSVKCPFISR